MTPQELKNSILQLAIQGKLVEQRPEEGTGEELYQKIQAEKQALIKAGKIKKEKPLPEISDGEKPFDIPESWRWVRLKEITYNRGQAVPQQTFSYIDIGSIDNIHQTLSSSENVIEAKNAPSRARRIVDKGDILYSTVRPYLHNMCIIDRDFQFQPIASTGFAAMTCFSGIYNKYLFYYLLSPTFDRYANANENAKGVAYPAINDDRLYRAIIALPPLAEQKRIVAKIEELLPLVDRYAEAWDRLESLNDRFPDDLKKSLLQLAIQGKLVPQLPDEGTGEELYRKIQAEKQRLIKEGKIKKEKPLPEITEEEKPFEIPESWRWVRVGAIGITQTGNTPSKSHPEYIGTDIAFITPGDILHEKINYSNQALSHLGKSVARVCKKDSILQVCIGGSIGKAAITNQEVAFNQQINVITPLLCSSKFIFESMQSTYFILGIKEKAGGTATPIINKGLWDTMLIPLPPLAEQKRIVAKLEEILPLCEELK